MTLQPLRIAALTAALTVVSNVTYGQNSPQSPVIKNANPASSPTTDDEGNNPMARAGETSPTGQGPSVPTNPPVTGSEGVGSKQPPQATAPEHDRNGH